MNRIKDYIGFAIWFAGLGYIALWPITSFDLDGQRFGASLFCGDASFRALDFLCRSGLPLQLPPNFHVLGFLSALFVVARLILLALRRSLRTADTPLDISALSMCLPEIDPPPRRKPPRPLPRAKPRAHFGLRGMPR
jgi:hypothetical protein